MAKTRKEHRDVQVARVNSKQAIVVASITAISTVAVTLLGVWLSGADGGGAPEESSTNTLTITGVEPVAEFEAEGYRLTVFVNDNAYSFPAQKLWGEPGRSWEPARLPLTPAPRYAVRFRGWLKKFDGTTESFGSSESHDVDAEDIGSVDRREYTSGPLRISYEVR